LFFRAVSLLRLVSVFVIVVGVHKAHAQNEPDEFLDDDEPFDEQVDDKGGQRSPGPRSRGPTTPKPPPVNEHPAGPSNADSGGSNSSDVSFHLVDPPKYWQPKKRHHRNQSKDQKDMTRINAEESQPSASAKAKDAPKDKSLR
jgi:hypothetical protein